MLQNAIPDSHFASLSALETGYWWYLARVAWAKRLVGAWLIAGLNNRPLVITYAFHKNI